MGNNPNNAAINVQIQAWLATLYANGIDHQLPLNPLPGEARISSGFGSRNLRNAPGATRNHEAIDMVPANGDRVGVPVGAVVSGRVLYAGHYNDASGYSLMIGGDNGKIYSYAHLQANSFRVSVGEHVARGQAVAIMGNTGNVSQVSDGHGHTVKLPCVHVVERQLPLALGEHRDFDKWSWHHLAHPDRPVAIGSPEHRRYMGQALRTSIAQYAAEHHQSGVTMEDFDKVPARFAWQENPRAGAFIAANTPERVNFRAETALASASRQGRPIPQEEPASSWWSGAWQRLGKFVSWATSGFGWGRAEAAEPHAAHPPTQQPVQAHPAHGGHGLPVNQHARGAGSVRQ